MSRPRFERCTSQIQIRSVTVSANFLGPNASYFRTFNYQRWLLASQQIVEICHIFSNRCYQIVTTSKYIRICLWVWGNIRTCTDFGHTLYRNESPCISGDFISEHRHVPRMLPSRHYWPRAGRLVDLCVRLRKNLPCQLPHAVALSKPHSTCNRERQVCSHWSMITSAKSLISITN
jgi:hypothetical protein